MIIDIPVSLTVGNGNNLEGDINGDGSTNVSDIVLLVSFILDFQTPNSQEFSISDLNHDLTLNVMDIVEIVGSILSGDTSDISLCGDVNNDGAINIIDIVALVGIILGDNS